MRHTKIIATLGPSSSTLQQIQALANAGVNVFRLNFSHGTHASHQALVDNINSVRATVKEPIGIMLDTKGPEIRTGDISSPIELEDGANVTMAPHPIEGEIGVSYADFVNDVKVGDNVLIDSGVMLWRVESVTERSVKCVVVRGGTLTSRRHVNLPGIDLSLPAVTDQDFADLAFGAEMGVDFVAMSFVRTEAEIRTVQAFLAEHGSTAKIIAKIETAQAVTNLKSILAVADGVMVARGDLGAEVKLADVPRIQRQIITAAREVQRPVIVATHMLESMIENPVPTRAEVSDVFHAVTQQTDGIMLSGETANGEHPVRAVEIMVDITHSAEGSHPTLKLTPRPCGIRCELSKLAVQMTRDIRELQGIVVLTRGGSTAISVSAYRPEVPIWAYTADAKTRACMSVVRGVESTCIPFHDTNPEVTIHTALADLAKAKPALVGQQIMLVADSLVDGHMVPMLQVRRVG